MHSKDINVFACQRNLLEQRNLEGLVKKRISYIAVLLHIQNTMTGSNHFLGIVKKGEDPSKGLQLQILVPDSLAGHFRRLSSIQMQEARPPEAGELDLTEYEGKVIMAKGHDGGRWIYSASIIDVAGPILTAVVNKLFGKIPFPPKP